VRCRRVIDADGNCQPTAIFIILDSGDEGDAILALIQEEMPGIVVRPWTFGLDGPEKLIRRGSFHEALIVLMRNQPVGETSMVSIRTKLDIGPSAYKSLMKALRDKTHHLSQALAEMRVVYVSPGRGTKSFLLKT
jgi:hypothetical protein